MSNDSPPPPPPPPSPPAALPPVPPQPSQAVESNESQSATATATKPAPTKPALDHLPPYRVLLHNDDVNDMLHVVHTIVELTPLNKQRAVEVMLEAHAGGVALVLVTHQERAELYAEQFRSKSLVVTVEPADA